MNLLRPFLACALAAGITAASVHADAALKLDEIKAEPAVAGEPLTVFVEASKLTKNRKVAVGTELRAEASATAPVVHTFAEGDAVALQKIENGWALLRLYQSAPVSKPAPKEAVAATKPEPGLEPAAPASKEPTLEVAAPAAPQRLEPAKLGVESPVRLFAGTLVKTRGFLFTTPPAEFEIIDAEGYRLAFVDISKLVRTLDTERMIDRAVQVSGRAEPVRGGKDTLIIADTLVLR